MKKLDGMVISELLTALIICGVIVAASISIFKAFDLTRTPYIYSVMKNLPVINSTVEDDCYKEGKCSQKRQLPNSRIEYCLRLINSITTTNAVNCNTDTDNRTSRNNAANNGGSNFYYNFTLSNGIAFFGLTDSDDWVSMESIPNHYIDILIDINGNHGTNTFGDDVFPIRIFQNGDVVPGVANLNQATNYIPEHYYNNEELFGYKVVLNTYKDNSLKSYDVDTRTTTEKNIHAPIITKMSLRQAYFSVYNNTKAKEVLERYYKDKQNGGWHLNADNTTRNQTDICRCAENPAGNGCSNYTILNNVESAQCALELAKPRGTGLIKLFGL